MFLARCQAANFRCSARRSESRTYRIGSDFALTCPADAGSSAVRAEIYLWCDRLEPGRDAECFGPTARTDIGLACEMVGGARPRTPTMPGAQGWSWERLALPAIVSATGIPRRIAKTASAPPPANSARRRHGGADPMGRASIRPAPLGLMAPIGAGSSTAARDRWSAATELFLTFSRNGRLLSRCRTA